MTDKMQVPRTHIPQVHALCPKCSSRTTIILASPHADGYHRRHRCKDIMCSYAFYTLAPYNHGPIQSSPLPFKDRELSEFEVEQRLQWWAEEAKQDPHTVTTVVTPEFINRMVLAICKPAKDRTEVEDFMVTTYEMLRDEVTKMEAPLPNNEDIG